MNLIAGGVRPDGTIETDHLPLEDLEPGRRHRLWVTLMQDGTGQPMRVPVLVARGAEDGPVVGITAAVHGNELNGLPTIHRLFRSLDPRILRGTVVAVPIANVPGFLRNTREFNDGADLNRLMPGREDGNSSQVYAHRLLGRVISRFGYLIDLHTASFGRVNSLYVRADMSVETTATLARLIRPQIIVHNTGGDGTLRSAASDLGIPAITVEVGDPQRFQRGLIRSSRLGILSVLVHLEMLPPDPHGDAEDVDDITVECSHSYWIYTDAGGVLEVLTRVAERVQHGERIAVLSDSFGDVVRTYRAREDGVIVGCSANPVAQTGARIVHLGIIGSPG